jgi:hypothetical protein
MAETYDRQYLATRVWSMGDMRAVPLLEELNADVQARAAELTDAA